MRSDSSVSRWLPLLLDAALLGVAFRVWNLLLFKEHLDRPGVVAGWLLAAVVLVIGARELAVGTPPERRTKVQHAWAGTRAPDLVLVGLLVVLVFLFHWGFQRAASDGREYFVQVRSLVMDRDLDFSNENAVFGVRGTAAIYAFGAPLLWTPFFVAAHLTIGLWNLLGAELPANGFANPYQRAIGLGSLFYGFVGLVLCYRMLSQTFSRNLAAVTTLAVTLGSFVTWYLVVDNSMSHAASMFAVTLFIYVWYRNRGLDPTPRRAAALGAAAGLMAMVRWQNVLFMVLPLLEEAVVWRREGASRFRRGLPAYGTFLAVFVVASFPQMAFWKTVSGSWIAPPAASHSVAWTEPQIVDVLFSSDRGLFSWTPLLLLAILGLPLFARRDRVFAAGLVLAFVGQVYINSLVEQGGHGFGARKFSACLVIFAFGLAAAFQWMKERPWVGVGVVAASLVLVNLTFMLDMNRSRVPPTGTITFNRMLTTTTDKLGNPFSLPASAWLAWRYDADLTLFERLGKQTFNNVHIDFGSGNDDRFLVRGWSGRETAPGFAYRWSDGPESSLVVRLKEAADYRLELRCAPLPLPGGERQVIEVWANGDLVERLILTGGMETHRIRLPAAVMLEGYNEIVLRYEQTASPRELGISEDPRRLGVQYDTLSLVRES